MEKNQLNGSADRLAQAFRDVISDAIQPIREDMAAMEQRLLKKIELNHVDHEAWIRRLDEKVTRMDDRMGRMETDITTMKADMTEVKARLPAGEQ